jgi:hypothetical protein
MSEATVHQLRVVTNDDDDEKQLQPTLKEAQNTIKHALKNHNSKSTSI